MRKYSKCQDVGLRRFLILGKFWKKNKTWCTLIWHSIVLCYHYTLIKGQQPITQSEIDEADDKFDPEEGNDGNDTDLYVDLPEEKTSLLTDEEDAHNAPTL